MPDKSTTPQDLLLDCASRLSATWLSADPRKIEVPDLLTARVEFQLVSEVQALDFRRRESVEHGSDHGAIGTPVVVWPAADPGKARDSARGVVLLTRALMSGQEATEMRLWVVGPAGTSDDTAWFAAREEIERDSLGCSKSVWLPGADPEKWPEEIARFLQRTFLARPWHVASGEQSSGRLLDDVATSLRGGRSPKEDEARLVDILLELNLEEGIPNDGRGVGVPEDGSDKLDPLGRAVLAAVEQWMDEVASDKASGATP